MARGRPVGSKNSYKSTGHGGDRRSKAFKKAQALKNSLPLTPYESKNLKSSPALSGKVDNVKTAKSTSTHAEHSTMVENTTTLDSILDIRAARGRLAARKSIEAGRQSVLMADVPVQRVVARRDSERQSVGSNGKKPTKSLQALAMLKREKRSTEKSPVKQSLKPSTASTTPDELPSLTGYLEMARKRKLSASSLLDRQKEVLAPQQPTSASSTEPRDKGKSVTGESSFSKLAREKRA